MTFAIVSSDGDIRLASPEWRPVSLKVTDDGASMPYIPNLMTAFVLMQSARKSASADEREAWHLLAACMMKERACILVSKDNALVGGCGYSHLTGSVLSLNTLCVATSWRRKGMGKRLFEFTVKHLANPDTRNVMLTVNDTNKDAIAFWDHMRGLYRAPADAEKAPPNLVPYLTAMSRVTHKGVVYLMNK